jgi:hypothetical protein
VGGKRHIYSEEDWEPNVSSLGWSDRHP